MSTLRQALAAYLALRQALGFNGSSAWKRGNSLILKGNIERLVATWTLPLFS